MAKLYHGTGLGNAIKIAEAGAILSPWKKQIRTFESVKREKPEEFERLMEEYPGMTLEEVAWEYAKTGHVDEELDHRVKRASFSRTLRGSFLYADQWSKHAGGLILMLDADLRKLEDVDSKTAIFIPEVSLEGTLKRIYLIGLVHDRFDLIKSTFDKFDPEYFLKFGSRSRSYSIS